MAFTASESRTLKVFAASGHFEGGDFWNLDDPTKPYGRIDPDATIDITIDWSDVMTDIGDTIAGINFELAGLSFVTGKVDGAKTSVVINNALSPTNSITFRMTSASTPPRIEDRTVYLLKAEQ